MRVIQRNPDDFNVYLTADSAYALRIISSGKERCIVTVQQDPRTMIMIQTDMSRNSLSDLAKPYPKTFRGDVAIRIATLPDVVDEIVCREIMASAFFSLDLEDALVEVYRESETSDNQPL